MHGISREICAVFSRTESAISLPSLSILPLFHFHHLPRRESAECNVEEAVDFDFHVEGKGTELALQEDLFSHRDLCSMMIGSGGGVGKCEKGARVARRASGRVDE